MSTWQDGCENSMDEMYAKAQDIDKAVNIYSFPFRVGEN